MNNNDAGQGGDVGYLNVNPAWFSANAAAGQESGLVNNVGNSLFVSSAVIGGVSAATAAGLQTFTLTGGNTIPAAVGAVGFILFFGSGLSALGITAGQLYRFDATSTAALPIIVNAAGTVAATALPATATAVIYSSLAVGGRIGVVSAAHFGSNQRAPVTLFTTGINDLTFTSSKTGVAVGAFGANTVQGVGNAPLEISGAQGLNINVLLTYDGAVSWVPASGLPSNYMLQAVGSFATIPGSAGSPGSGGSPPTPVITNNDLTSVFFASKTLGWAVGGNDVSLAAMSPTTTAQPQGVVFTTMNGGTLWKLVPTFVSVGTLGSLWRNNDPSLKTIFSNPVPGILFSVSSDASGKHVFAVGSPGTMQMASGPTAIIGNTVAATTVLAKVYGTILYSGNSGMSWVQQTAPTLFNALRTYTLFDVAVQKGTTAIAVGGSAKWAYGNNAAGTIICTSNGGFSWMQAVYPGSAGTSVPTFTSVSLQPSIAGVQSVWVGGFTSRTDQATLPTATVSIIASTSAGNVLTFTSTVVPSVGDVFTIASYSASTGTTIGTLVAGTTTFTVTAVSPAGVATATSSLALTASGSGDTITASVTGSIGSAAGFYPVAAVTGLVSTTGTISAPAATTVGQVSSGVPASRGSIYTVLISKDSG